MSHFKDTQIIKHKNCIYKNEAMSMRDFASKNKINKKTKTSIFKGVSLSKKTVNWVYVIIINNHWLHCSLLATLLMA